MCYGKFHNCVKEVKSKYICMYNSNIFTAFFYTYPRAFLNQVKPLILLQRGCTPLIAVSSKGNLELVEALIEEGSDVNKFDEVGFVGICSMCVKRTHLVCISIHFMTSSNRNVKCSCF